MNDRHAAAERESLQERGSERGRFSVNEEQVESPKPKDVAGPAHKAANDGRYLCDKMPAPERDGEPGHVEERRQGDIDPEATKLRQLLLDP
jgi:hypothetical protein